MTPEKMKAIAAKLTRAIGPVVTAAGFDCCGVTSEVDGAKIKIEVYIPAADVTAEETKE